LADVCKVREEEGGILHAALTTQILDLLEDSPAPEFVLIFLVGIGVHSVDPEVPTALRVVLQKPFVPADLTDHSLAAPTKTTQGQVHRELEDGS
jgi:hypothetical protein